MPPRRRITIQNPEADPEADPEINPEANPEGFLTEGRAAELFAKTLNDVLPALVTQIAQAIHGEANPPPSPPPVGGGGDGPEPHVIIRIPNDPPIQNAPIAPIKRCTFQTFSRCNPPTFKGTEGAVGLMSWFEAMEAVLYHSESEEHRKVEFASSQLKKEARKWWDNVVRIRGSRAAAYQLTWEELKELMRVEYCSKAAMTELEHEFWNLQMKDLEIDQYITRFNELSGLVPHLITPEGKRVDRFVYGLTPDIRRDVITSNPATMQDATVLAKQLARDVARSKPAAKTTVDTGKCKLEGTSGSQNTQNKKGRTAKAYAAVVPEFQALGYVGTSPKCQKCQLHHTGTC